MKKSDKLSRKLLSYSTATGAFLAIGTVANGQAVFTDEVPDAYYTGAGPNLHEIDMNTDANVDFQINQSYITSTSVSTWTSQYTTYYGSVITYSNQTTSTWTWNYVGIQKLQSSFGIMNPNSSNYACLALDQGEVIDSSDNFNLVNRNWNIGSNSWNGFDGAGDKYVGVKFNISGDTHYGWILVNVDSYSSGVTIKGYAYESQPGVFMHAGDTIGVYTDSIAINNITSNAADAGFFPSAQGNAYYVVQLQSDIKPTPAEVVAGTGSASATLAAVGNKAVSAGVNDVFNLASLTPSTAYAFYLVMVDATGITSLVDSVPFVTTSGVGIEEGPVEISVYPIPAVDVLNIDLDSDGKVCIYSLDGRKVYDAEMSQGKTDIDISSLEAGNYIIEFLSDEKTSRMKFIKQ